MSKYRVFNPISQSHTVVPGLMTVDDKRVLSGIIFIIRNGSRCCDAPPEYGPSIKHFPNVLPAGQKNGVFKKIFEKLVKPSVTEADMLMIDATHLKAHRTASSLKKKGASHA